MDRTRYPDTADVENAPWGYMPFVQLKSAYERDGFILAVLETRPPTEADTVSKEQLWD